MSVFVNLAEGKGKMSDGTFKVGTSVYICASHLPIHFSLFFHHLHNVTKMGCKLK